jgi:hypothetical protein
LGNPNNVATTDPKPGKFKLPKPALVTTKPGNNKPVIKVPETPDRTIVNRPALTRPDNDLKLPGIGDKPNRIPSLRNPETNPTNTADSNNGPNPKPFDPKPSVNNLRPGRDPNPLGDRTLDNEGNKKPSTGSSSAAAAAQARLEALRAQQQQQLNRLRNPGNNVSGNTGGNTGNNKPITPRIETPRVETPRIETPRTEKPKVNLQPRNEVVPRNLAPSNPPRNPQPMIDRTPSPRTVLERPITPAPRNNPPPRVEPRFEPRNNPAPRIEPRSNPAPRIEPRSNPGSGQNNGNDKDKRRGR